MADRHPGLTVSTTAGGTTTSWSQVGVVAEAELAAIAGDVWHPSLGGDLPLRLNRAVLDCDHVILLARRFPTRSSASPGGAKVLLPRRVGPEMIDVALARRSEWGRRHDRTRRHPRPADSSTTQLRADPDPGHARVMVVVDDARLAGVFCRRPRRAWRRAAGLSATRHIRTRTAHAAGPVDGAAYVRRRAVDRGQGVRKLEPVLADDAELVIFAPHLRGVSRVHGRSWPGSATTCCRTSSSSGTALRCAVAVLAHSTHMRGAGTSPTASNGPGAGHPLQPGARGRVPGPGPRLPRPDSVDVADWTGREDGVLLVVPRRRGAHRLAER